MERTAGTFQDRLVTELRLAGADSIGAANRVLDKFLPRYNRRFRVPSQRSESAYRPLDPDLCLEQVLCFKHRRKVAKDNTVKFQLHTLQLLPEPERPCYAGAVVEVLEGLDGRLRGAPLGTHYQRPGGSAQPGIPPRRPRRFPNSSCLARRIRPVEPALVDGPQFTGLKASG